MNAVKKEDKNTCSSLFIAGARPFLTWVLTLSLAWQFLVSPILICAFYIFDIHLMVVNLDIEMVVAILCGLLGMGGLRTYEKNKGVARESL
jgi:hypothetical protein